jgi:hypothetical protein
MEEQTPSILGIGVVGGESTGVSDVHPLKADQVVHPTDERIPIRSNAGPSRERPRRLI